MLLRRRYVSGGAGISGKSRKRGLVCTGKIRKKISAKKVEFMVDKWLGSGYNSQAVFPREQRFAAVLELVDRPA